MEFGDRKDFGVVHLIVVLVLGGKDSVELIMEFGNLPEESKAAHKNCFCKDRLYTYSFFIYLGH